MRFGLDGSEPKTLKEIGDCLGLTRERVRQIELEALGKLREIMEAA
jgi:RNA polymerase primary sigma factor